MLVPHTAAAEMSATSDATQSDSWTGSSGIQEAVQYSRDSWAVSDVQPLPHAPVQGWDPYDVWLRRIELPRRLRRQLG